MGVFRRVCKRRGLYRRGQLIAVGQLIAAVYGTSIMHRPPKCDLRETPVLIATVEPRYITKGQGTGKICSLLRGFVISRFFSIYFPITGVKKIFRYIKDYVM